MNAPTPPPIAGHLAESVLEAMKRLCEREGRELTDEERSGVAKLLQMLALDMPPPRPCAACKRMIWFFRTRGGRLMPIDDSGRDHFATCTNPELFRKPR